MTIHRILTLCLFILYIAPTGCALTDGESVDEASADTEPVTEATDATVIAPPPVTVKSAANPSFPTVSVPANTDMGLLNFQFACSVPNCNVGPITLRSALLFAEPYSPMKLYDLRMWVNNVVSNKREWDLHFDGGVTWTDFTQPGTIAPLSEYSGNVLHYAAKSFTLGGLTTTDDVVVQVGDIVSFTGKHDGSKPGAVSKFRMTSLGDNNHIAGMPTRELPTGAGEGPMYAGATGKGWFFKNTETGGVSRALLLFKVQGTWYATAAGPYNLENQVSAQ